MASAGQGNAGANLGSALLQGRQARINQSVAEAEKAAAMKKSQQELEKYQSEQILKAQKEGFQTPVFTGTGYGMEPLQMDPNMPQPSAGFSEKTSSLYDKDSGQTVTQLVDGNGNIRLVNAAGQPWNGNPASLIDPRFDPQLQRDIAAGKSGGNIAGAEQAQAEVDLPSLTAETESMVSTIDKLRGHPGTPEFVGSLGAAGWVPKSDAAGAAALYDQVVGFGGMASYEKLKGAGQITEFELKTAQNAFGRLQNLRQGSEDWYDALDDFEASLRRINEKLAKKAKTGRQSTAPNKPISEMTDEELQAIIGG